MHIHTRILTVMTAGLLALAWNTSAEARGRGHQDHDRPAQHDSGHESQPRPAVEPAPGERLDGDLDRLDRHKLHRRRCRDKARHGAPGGCYWDDDGWYEDVALEAAPPAAPRSEASGQDIQQTEPRLSEESGVEFIAPSGNPAMKEELIAVRRIWLEKKSIADEASAARARAEYQAEQTGEEVDPRLIEQERLAREEAGAAQASIGPVVQRARREGFSPEVLDLYERANRED